MNSVIRRYLIAVSPAVIWFATTAAMTISEIRFHSAISSLIGAWCITVISIIRLIVSFHLVEAGSIVTRYYGSTASENESKVCPPISIASGAFAAAVSHPLRHFLPDIGKPEVKAVCYD